MITNKNRNDAKKRNTLNHKKRQFAAPSFKSQDYPYRLNLYTIPPTEDITLEQFETWAIDRLRILAELEACSFRNKTPSETAAHISPLLQKVLPLRSNTSSSEGANDESLKLERQKDHYSHYILRLAFSATEDLRRRFERVEGTLFKIRFQNDDARERQAFVESLALDWEVCSEEEKRSLSADILNATPGLKKQEVEEGGWFKVDFETVPELVESRRVYLKAGKAYVPVREQLSMVLAGFNTSLSKGLELAARALPRLDEDDRLSPILDHLAKNFGTPDSSLADSESILPGASINAASIDSLSQHFPLCMRHLHIQLRKNSHLKHYGRLQYTLFLKGIGLTLEDCLIFWRQAFKLITDDVFNKEYRYNVRHTYGDVGGDATRRGRGYSPFSCLKILTEHPPGSGEAHGCPYRHFSMDNLTTLLQQTGVSDRDVLHGVKADVEKQKFHLACNRVFEYAHRTDIKRVKDDGSWSSMDLDTIVHPNTYFKRSFLLTSGEKPTASGDRSDQMDVS